MTQPTPLKQNMIWLRTLANLLDEGSFITSVDVQSHKDKLTLSLVAQQREGNKTETTTTYHRLRKALNRWQKKTTQQPSEEKESDHEL